MRSMRRIPIVFMALAVLTACSEGTTDIIDDGDDDEGPAEHAFVFIPSANTPDITSINVAGSFAEEGEALFWNPEMQGMTEQDDGSWEFAVELDPGTYEYKYVFNGDQWPGHMCDDETWGNPDHDNKIDPNVQECIEDGFGGANAALTID